ncbi:precorrin-3B synthase [Actinomycetospora cinnamomea]|uniref:Precorrin-3B synthase n=1 Tax=Actinomycetospora cinnamomea TaxID=663609 RepID=A0A2U1E8H7_9PSEU|nr:precorrin-3B synthase [Actinomycetospora cinnamomea]PVY96185.1 precorrin-3B synthase [Actinomycetospora cinnamomea]
MSEPLRPAGARQPTAGPPARTVPDACPGAWRRHDATDGALARFRPVGGAVAAAELRALSRAAAAGGSPLELTSRGSLQVRGLTADAADALAEELATLATGSASLLDAQGRDLPCSVVASPRSSRLDGAAAALADALRGRTDVPGRLLVALDDGSGDVAGLGADVTVALAGERASLTLAGTPTDVTADDPAGLALAAVEAFLAVRGSAWRVAEVGAERVLFALRARACSSVPQHGRARTRPDAREVLPRLGEVGTDAAQVLADLGDAGAALRVTPWRTVVLRGLADPDDAMQRLDGLVETGPSPWSTLSACVGAPRCARSHTDVRGDLTRAVAAGRAGGLLPAHWVGCARACGTPAGPVAVVEGTPSGTYRTIVRAGKVSP